MEGSQAAAGGLLLAITPSSTPRERPAGLERLPGTPPEDAREDLLGWSESQLERFLARPPVAAWLAEAAGAPAGPRPTVLRQVAGADLCLPEAAGRPLAVHVRRPPLAAGPRESRLRGAAVQAAATYPGQVRSLGAAPRVLLVGPFSPAELEAVAAPAPPAFWARAADACGGPPALVAWRALRDDSGSRFLWLGPPGAFLAGLPPVPRGGVARAAPRLWVRALAELHPERFPPARSPQRQLWSYRGASLPGGIRLEAQLEERRFVVRLAVEEETWLAALGGEEPAALRAFRWVARARDRVAPDFECVAHDPSQARRMTWISNQVLSRDGSQVDSDALLVKRVGELADRLADGLRRATLAATDG